MSQLWVTLPSDSSMDFHPENTLSNFTTRLHHPIDLGHGEWEVGLSEIIYPNVWRNIRNAQEGMMHFVTPSDTTLRNYTLKPGFYPNGQSLCKALTDMTQDNVTFQWLPHEFRVRLTFARAGAIVLSDVLSKMLGLDKMTEGDEGIHVHGKTVWDTKRDLHALYVYCSIMEHQLVGDVSAPLLRVLPIRGNHGQTLSRTFQNIHYMPAKMGHVQNIEIDIRDNVGDPVPFEAGRVVVVLHLRKATQAHWTS